MGNHPQKKSVFIWTLSKKGDGLTQIQNVQGPFFSLDLYIFKMGDGHFCWLEKTSSEMSKNTRGGVNATLTLSRQKKIFLGQLTYPKQGEGGGESMLFWTMSKIKQFFGRIP